MTAIDIPSQFRKLCPSYSRSIDMSRDEMKKLVNQKLEGMRRLGSDNHWAYDLNTHMALIELKKAMEADQ